MRDTTRELRNALPAQVRQLKQQLRRDSLSIIERSCLKLLQTLTSSPDCIAMWRTLERHKGDDPVWVGTFLGAVTSARIRDDLHHHIAAGKARGGRNAGAVRFARQLAEMNRFFYGGPLNTVVATATNALFGTNYQPSDIRNLLRGERRGTAKPPRTFH